MQIHSTVCIPEAVVGVTGFFEGDRLTAVGIQCSLCHSTVDDSLAKGIGRRLDGWANRDLNVGAIIAFAPRLEAFASLLSVDVPTVRKVLLSWGPGKFDAELLLDGKAFQPDGRSAATLLPSAFGLAGVNLHTYTGWGSVTHWNAFVANIEMQGKGTFFDPRLDDATRFPIAARERFGHLRAWGSRRPSAPISNSFYCRCSERTFSKWTSAQQIRLDSVRVCRDSSPHRRDLRAPKILS